MFNSRTSAERVREYVEFLYMSERYSLGERLEYALHRSRNPYPATFGQTQGQIFCGHNPFLYGRLVDDFRVDIDGSGEGRATWTERPPIRVSELRQPLKGA